ncbi:MAG: hypothetical protein V5804_04095 [Mucilaginibacter sp.]|uniref:hypothetical protein n=1 Tax=Mucilaginibacter sp. TaxID=1882438 RepID=UPI0034E58082
MKYLYRPNPIWLLALLIITQGCGTIRPAINSEDNTNNYCTVPHQVFTIDTLHADKAASLPMLDTSTIHGLSPRSLQLTHAYGLNTGLQQLIQRGKGLTPTSPAYPAFLKQRKAIVLQIVDASADVLQVAEELECEKQRAEQSAIALQGREDKQRNNLTVGSLLFGAVGSTVSATVKNSHLNLVLTVSTAVLSAALGVATILVNPQINYPINQNLLADVWYQHPRSALYPTGLWTVLNEKRERRSNQAVRSLLQTSRMRWAKYDQLTKGKPQKQQQQQKLFFGNGGSYHIDDLHTLSNMLTEIEVMVRSVNQDLQKLQVEVSNLEPQ